MSDDLDTAQLQDALEGLGTAFDELKAANNKALEEKANKGEVDPLTKDRLDKIQATLDEKSALIEAAGVAAKATSDAAKADQERISELETVISRSGVGAPDSKAELELRSQACYHIITDHYDMGRPIELLPEDVDELDVRAFALYDRHFDTYIRRGSDAFLKKLGLPNLETKLLSVDRDPGGGYWVRPDISARITKIVFETSPTRQFAAVETIGSDSLELIADEQQAGFGWVAEQADRTETTTPDIGKRVIHAHELYAEPRATQKLLDDAGFNVENWLAGKVAERFARAEATAHVVGTGVGQPRGFTTYPAGTSTGQIEQVNSGSAGAVTFDGLIKLIYSVKGPYLRNARFMAARLTIRDVRILKDGQGRYLWEPTTQAGQPSMILGYPIHQADDMAAVASNSLSIVFGDFRAAYTIVDRMGIRTLRDPYTAKPYIKLYTTRRTGGDVVNYEALKLQKLAA